MFRKKTSHSFAIKGIGTGKVELVKDPRLIKVDEAQTILIESFINEYKQYLLPSEVDEKLTSWYDGKKSVKKYYENYFKNELNEFIHGKIHYWAEASIDGNLVGWVTFQREKFNSNAFYMNTLVVHPKFQQKGIGAKLVEALIHLNEIPDLSAIHLLLRKKNIGGRKFYSKFGFIADPGYSREDNFIDTKQLEGWTWNNPMFHPPISPLEVLGHASQGESKKYKYLAFGLFTLTTVMVAVKAITHSNSNPKPSI